MVKKIQLKDWNIVKSKRYVFYYDPERESECSKYIEENLEDIMDFFYGKRMEFCYLPAISKDFTSERIKYKHPEWNGEPLMNVGNDVLKDYLPKELQQEACLLRCVEFYDEFYYCKLKPIDRVPFREQIEDFCNKIYEDTQDHIAFCFDDDNINYDDVRFSVSPLIVNDEPTFEKKYCLADENFDSIDFNFEILSYIRNLKLSGVEEFVLKCMVPTKNKLSRIVISPKYEILLPDYGDMNIAMSPLPKAVFLLFLKHEEGIYFKALSDYRDELQTIYSKITNRISGYVISKSIAQITDPTKNAINEKCSRIREAFLMKMDDAIAKNYYINGNRGEVKKIDIPRNLVEWQCEI